MLLEYWYKNLVISFGDELNVIRLSKKSMFLLKQLQKAISLTKRHGDKKQVRQLEEELNQFLEPKKSKFFKLHKDRKYKKKIKIKPGTDPRIIARKLNGAKGGNKTAALYSKETRAKWGSKAGTSTLQRYGREFFSHIRKNRKKYPKHRRRVK